MQRDIILVRVDCNIPGTSPTPGLIREKVVERGMQNTDGFTFTPAKYGLKTFNGMEGRSWQTEDVID
jgi:hypothetical protein